MNKTAPLTAKRQPAKSIIVGMSPPATPKDEYPILTKGLNDFNVATANTSYAKCTQDYNYYLMKCYDYFIYVFDKKNKRCFMLIKNNKKALTMINILILTPYLMYGELFAVHGGLVNKDDKNILINNSSLGGKTTFAILFASNKWDIITEETTYITNSGKNWFWTFVCISCKEGTSSRKT